MHPCIGFVNIQVLNAMPLNHYGSFMSLPPAKRAFSLVELSIVLVILGLLIGGILSGQSLIRASELRSISSDFMRYQSAALTFRDKYFAFPGDMTNATLFWGFSGTTVAPGCTGSGSVVSPGTCDGNGDGTLSWPPAAATTGETYQFWNHLARAGLIEGTYTGIPGAGEWQHDIHGTNVPKSRISSVGWSAESFGGWAGNSELFAISSGKTIGLSVGKAPPTNHSFYPFLTAAEAWSIDKKLDDGMPGQGKVIGRWWATCTNAADKDDTTTTYKLDSSSNEACALLLSL
jgi:prepilin-type N-terminal cleavage/methylation domain-containing protein